MEQINFNLISSGIAREINQHLKGHPTENRVMLAVDPAEKKTTSGLYIPGNAQGEIPKKGVIVALGTMDQDHLYYSELRVGDVIQYGQYGGKEVFPEVNTEAAANLKFYVLSASEIIYIEPNPNN